MKAIIFVVCMCIVSASFAAQTMTDCDEMREQNYRDNPKAPQSFKVTKKKRNVIRQ